MWQLYDNRAGLYIREFTNGWATNNHSWRGAGHHVSEKGAGGRQFLLVNIRSIASVRISLTGRCNPNRRQNPRMGMPYITLRNLSTLNLGAALLFDPIELPARTTTHWVNHWVNLRTVGESLLASRAPRIEEGEIELPSIGFS